MFNLNINPINTRNLRRHSVELARRLELRCEMKPRSSNRTRCDICKGELRERSSAIIQTHGVLILSCEPPVAKDEGQSRAWKSVNTS